MCLETSQGASRYQQSYYSVWAAESSSVWFRSFQSILSKVWLHPLPAMRWLPTCLLRITVKNVSNTYKLNYYVPNCKNQMQWKKKNFMFHTRAMKNFLYENYFWRKHFQVFFCFFYSRCYWGSGFKYIFSSSGCLCDSFAHLFLWVTFLTAPQCPTQKCKAIDFILQNYDSSSQ